jgi:hypothetical protein
MTKDNINNLLLTRVAVAVIGEELGWWDTKFFNESSKAFLNFTFPRSKNVQYASAFDAIKSIIDKKVGPNNFHLFRLSINYEEQIHNQLIKGDFDKYLEIDKAKDVLKEFANNLVVDSTQGPKNIGSVNEIDDNLIQAFAAEYLKACDNNYESYPYLN